MIRKKRRYREGGIQSFDVQPSKLPKLVTFKPLLVTLPLN